MIHNFYFKIHVYLILFNLIPFFLLKIYDAEHKRFEPMQPEITMVSKPLTKMKYRVQVDGSLIGFKIIRNSDNVTM